MEILQKQEVISGVAPIPGSLEIDLLPVGLQGPASKTPEIILSSSSCQGFFTTPYHILLTGNLLLSPH